MLQATELSLEERLATYTPERIDAMVRGFYERVQADPLLAPVFARKVSDWEPHLVRMGQFWRSILRGEGGFVRSERGGPPALHGALPEVRAAHFERWLHLFEDVAREHLPSPAVDALIPRAMRMARTLSGHLSEPFDPERFERRSPSDA